MLKTGVVWIGCTVLLVTASSIQAQDHAQQIGSPLDTSTLDLEPVYENDFSGEDRIDFEFSFVEVEFK